LVAVAITTASAGVARAEYELQKSQVVYIEVVKFVRRPTAGGNYKSEMETWIGSGFRVAGTNRVVTCAHVLEGARQVCVSPYWNKANESPCPCPCRSAPVHWTSEAGQVSLCRKDPKHDIAILEIPDGGGTFPFTNSAAEGASIMAVGHTEGFPWRVNGGKYSGLNPAQQPGLAGDMHVCDVNFGPGSSGGIVVDKDNRILGMIQGGTAYTRYAVPSSYIKALIDELPKSCRDPVGKAGPPANLNEQAFSNLLRDETVVPDIPARYWGSASFGQINGIDDFDDQVPSYRFDLLRTGVSSWSYVLALEWGHREVDRTLSSGTLDYSDGARIDRFAATVGPRYLTAELGQVALYSSARVGYVHDQITHDYAFTSPLFAPQSHSQTTSGVLGAAGLDAEVFIVTNLRVGGGVEFWQGTGNIGNGLTVRVLLRAGVGHGLM
jgi:hypothetical protein